MKTTGRHYITFISVLLMVTGALAEEGVRTPLRFTDSEVVIPRKSYQFIYEVERMPAPEIFMGPWRLSAEAIFLRVGAWGSVDPIFASRVKPSTERIFYIGWRNEFIAPQKVIFKDETGRVLLAESLKEKHLKQWREEQDRVRQELINQGIREERLNQSVLLRNGFALDADMAGVLEKHQVKFQACLFTESPRFQVELCSPYYQTQNQEWVPVTSGSDLGLEINGAKAPDRGSLPVKVGQDFKFKFHLSNGFRYEFQSLVPGFVWEDFSVQGEGAQKQMALQAEGAPPVNLAYKLDPKKEAGWQETIGDFRNYWTTQSTKSEMVLFVRGPGAGVYQLVLDLSRIPSEKYRLFIDGPSRRSTYLGYYEETLLVPEGLLQVQSSELEIRDLEAAEKNKKIWKLGLPYQGEFNKSHVNIKTPEGVFKLSKETYRAFPGEFSLRLSTISSGGSLATLGELYTSYWFEDFIYKSPATYQHFGMSGRYTTSMTKLKSKTSQEEASLSSMNVFLKYRFQPGVWERDEAVGMYLTTQNFTLGEVSTTNLGTGIFWARSMPKVFDDAMNVVPYFRFPKWVDMDFIVYPVNLNSETESRLSWELNFHGKLLWTKSFWGEMGFGARSYNLKKTSEDLNVRFAPFYGTLGLGVNF